VFAPIWARVIGGVGALLIALWFSLPPIIETVAKSQMESIGIADADLKVAEISLTHIAIAGVRLGRGGDLEIPELQATFTWAELFSGRMDDLRISGLKLRLTKTENGLSFGALDPLFVTNTESGSSTSGATIKWPLKQLILEDSVVEIRSPFGTTLLPFSGRIGQDDHGVVRLDQAILRFVHPNLAISAEITASLEPSGILSAKLDILEGHLEFGEINARLTGGQFSATGNLSNLNDFKGGGALTVGSSSVPLGFTPKLALEVALGGGDLSANFILTDTPHGVTGGFETKVLGLFDNNPQVKVGSQLALSNLGYLPKETGLPEGLSGNAQLGISLGMGYEDLLVLASAQSAEDALNAMPVTHIALKAAGLGLKEQKVELWAEGNLALFAHEGKLAMGSKEGLHVWAAEREAKVFQSLFGPLYAPLHEGPLAFTLKPRGKAVLSLHRPDDQILVIESHAELSAEGGGLAAITGLLDSTLHLSQSDFAIQNFELKELKFNAEPLPIGKALARLNNASMTLAGTPQVFDGTLEVDLSLSGTLPNDIQVKGAKVAIAGPLHMAENRLTFGSGDCSTLRLESLSIAGVGKAPNPMALCMKGQRGELFSATLKGGAVERADVTLRLIGKTPRFDFFPAVGPKTFIRSKPLKIDLQLSTKTATGETTAKSSISGLDIIIPQYKITLADLRLTSHGEGTEKAQTATTQLNIGEIFDSHAPRFFEPVTFRANLDLKEGIVEVAGAVKGQGHPFNAEFDGRYELEKDEGFFTARTPPLTFAKDKLKITTIVPIAAQWVKSLEGMVMAAAQLDWEQGTLKAGSDLLLRGVKADITADTLGDFGTVSLGGGQVAIKLKAEQPRGGDLAAKAQVLLEKASLAVGGATLEQINTVVTFSSLSPLTTLPKQKVALALLDVGLPFTDGQGEFQLHPDGRLDLNGFSFDWFGGKVEAAPLTFDGKKEETSIKLTVAGADLQRLTTHMEVEGLDVTGILDGELPIFIGNGEVRIKDGMLETRGPGTLSYIKKGAEEEEGAGAMALQALSNFHYEKLSLLINGEVDGNVEIKSHVKGKNPDFFDGYPVELDVGVNGQLGRIAKDGLTNYEVPETIKKRMLGFGQ
jgi:hypothetical protein